MAYDMKAFAEAYKSEDLAQLEKLDIIDPLRMHQYRASLERTEKEKDPSAKHKALAQLWGDVMQTGAYFAGQQKLGGKIGDLGLGEEESLSLFIQTGASLVDKILKE